MSVSVLLNVLIIFVIAISVFLLLMVVSKLLKKDDHIDKLKRELEEKEEQKRDALDRAVEVEEESDRVTEIEKESDRVEESIDEIVEPLVETPDITKYPPFSHERAKREFGLGDSEAVEFIKDLVVQLDDELPLLRKALDDDDIAEIRRLSHLLKGSSSSLGDGGVSDAIASLDEYLSGGGSDLQMIGAMIVDVEHYSVELKSSYS